MEAPELPELSQHLHVTLGVVWVQRPGRFVPKARPDRHLAPGVEVDGQTRLQGLIDDDLLSPRQVRDVPWFPAALVVDDADGEGLLELTAVLPGGGLQLLGDELDREPGPEARFE